MTQPPGYGPQQPNQPQQPRPYVPPPASVPGTRMPPQMYQQAGGPRPPDQAGAPGLPYPPGKPPKQKPFGWLALIIAAVAGLVIGGVAFSGGDGTTAAPGAEVTVTETAAAPDGGPAPTATVTKTVDAKPPKQPEGITDGQYLVGKEIDPGTWKLAKVEGSLCYADTKNKGGDILEQEVAKTGDSVIIRVKASAYTFTSKDCGTWKKVD